MKYFSKADAMNLIETVKAHYTLTIDWTGKLYCGLALDWHYDEGYINISMPGYVTRALQKFDHPAPLRPQHAPHHWNTPIYDSCKPQLPTPDSKAQRLDKQGAAPPESKSSTAPSCIMAAHVTPAFSRHSTKSHPNRLPQQPTPSPEPPCSWTTSTRTHTESSATTQAI
jgi:hypothetical protein